MPSVPLVSIIVPVYNVEYYLGLCVESIKIQSKDNIEIILVDDKSPDGSGVLADELSKTDSRIKVIHKLDNEGLGPARNSGIDAARGEYLMFVDADDWIDEGMVDALYNFCNKNDLDICFCGRRIVSDGKVRAVLPHPLSGSIISGSEILCFRNELYGPLPEKIIESPIPVSAWAALYKRSFVTANCLRFINIRSEDMVFNITACKIAKKIGFHDGVYYNYRKDNQPSITNNVSRQSVESYFLLFNKVVALANSEPEDIKDECCLRAARRVIDTSRSAISVIYDSRLIISEKRSLAKMVVENPVLQKILSNYPISKVPFNQFIFSYCMKEHLLYLCELLARIRNWHVA